MHDMDKEQTIIGYRASEHSNDKGYNVFYDIVTGNLYQLDQLRIKMLATLRKDLTKEVNGNTASCGKFLP